MSDTGDFKELIDSLILASEEHVVAVQAGSDTLTHMAAEKRDRIADGILTAYRKVCEERDLAVAHDTQSYPTAQAYETVCAALHVREDMCEWLAGIAATYGARLAHGRVSAVGFYTSKEELLERARREARG